MNVIVSGQTVMIDEEDINIFNSFSWSITSKGYVRSTISFSKKQLKTIFLHRLIMNIEDSKLQVDHINHNKLDNRKSNLRLCTNQENQRNTKAKTGVSEYKGVYFAEKKWRSEIYINGKKDRLFLGCFNLEEDAACAYDMAAIHYFGEFAYTNFDKNSYSDQEIKDFITKINSPKIYGSKYRGVTISLNRDKKYRAITYYRGIKYDCGSFYSEEEAARAYDKKAIELLGDKAKLNFPNEVLV